MSTLVVAGAVVVPDEDAAPTAVRIDDGTITEIGVAEALRRNPSEREIELDRLVLVPGFVDTHVHITGNGSMTAALDMQRDPKERLLLNAAENARRAVREGLTTVRDLGARNDVALALREAANGGAITAPRMFVAGAPLTRTGGHGHWWGLEADTTDEVVRAVRHQSKLGVDTLKVMVDGGIDLGRHVPGLLYFDEEDLAVAVREAHHWGLTVAAHCLTAAGVRSAVGAGVDSVEHAIFYEQDLDDTRFDPDVGRAMLEGGIAVAPGQAFAYEAFTGPEAERAWPRNARLFHRRLEDDARMHEQGVDLVAGSDAGWYATPFGHYALIPRLFVEQVGMTPSEAFAACTSAAARSLGLSDETGTIEVGKRADLVALGGDPRVDVRSMEDVQMTMVEGRVVHDRRGIIPPEPLPA